jgi:hypothetical protein
LTKLGYLEIGNRKLEIGDELPRTRTS